VATGYIPPDPEFKAKVEDICEVYELAMERAERGEMTFSLDEMTGIQALERRMPDIPMKPGRCVKVEFEYLRHGAQALIASFNVASGHIAQADVGEHRAEEDLDTHLRALLAQHPKAPKTHKSDGLSQYPSIRSARPHRR
jgi:DDE superfamily endonuclease